jgi:hypothetical protein
MATVLDRDALYYPRIHIRDPLWLKQTLLCFPQVRRMVPSECGLSDLPEIREFRELAGPRGQPLLAEEDVYGYDVYQAQLRLTRKLEEQSETRMARFTRPSTRARYGDAIDSYQIHRGKLVDMLSFLESRDLAWQPAARSRDDWVAVHPRLGKAIMSYVAIAIATSKGLDIVTDSESAHSAVTTLDEELVFEELIRGRTTRRVTGGDATEKVDELVQVVMRSCFDVSKLTPSQIAQLVNDGKDLRAFKQALIPLAMSIPEISDPNERQKRFRAGAEEVVSMWNGYRKSLPRFALDAIVEATKTTPPAGLAALTA